MAKEADVRRGRDYLVRGIVDTQKQIGAVPNVALAEKWATPIVEQGAREQATQDETRRVPSPIPATKESAGDVHWDLKTNKLTPDVRTKVKRRFIPVKLEDLLIARRLKLLKNFPDWADKIREAWISPLPVWLPPETDNEMRVKRVMKIIEDSDKVFGERKLIEQVRKIIV